MVIFLKFSNCYSLNLNNLQRSHHYCSKSHMFFFLYPENKCFYAKYFYMLFSLFFVILCHRGWKTKSFLFPGNDFGTIEFLFGQLCQFVTFTSCLTPSFGILLSKLHNRNTHVCTSSIRMIRFFLPFSVNCSQVTMFQIMPALWPHGQGEGSGQPNVDKPAQREEGSQKFPKLCGHPLWMTPKGIIKNL